MSRILDDESDSFRQVCHGTPVSERTRWRRILGCGRSRDQKGAQVEGGVLRHDRPDAVIHMQGGKLEFDDIQHILLTRAPAITGRYEFLSFRNAAGGRAWLSAILEKVHSAAAVRASVGKDKRWVSVAFTWNGLRALGVDDTSLATFPEEFKQGMVARAEILGDSGANHPKNWVDNTASPELHAIVILFAQDPAERGRCESEHKKLIAQGEGVEVLSSLDLEAVPPLGYAHDHFGYRDRLSEPAIEGSGDEPRPGFGGSVKAGELIRGYPDEAGTMTALLRPEVLSRNGSYIDYGRMQEQRGGVRRLRRHT